MCASFLGVQKSAASRACQMDGEGGADAWGVLRRHPSCDGEACRGKHDSGTSLQPPA